MQFQRTLRIPDDHKTYPLPPGLGAFPLRHLDDYARRLQEDWIKRGGILMPMSQAEAMWVNFYAKSSWPQYPFALKIATGKINAVSGRTWRAELSGDPQDYVVIPGQPWLDGYNVAKGLIRQFIAMPLGDGYSVEEQITGLAEHGGLQIIAYPMKAARYQKLCAESTIRRRGFGGIDLCGKPAVPAEAAMGLAPGGRMKQDIFDDPHGLDAWDQDHASKCFVTIANSAVWAGLTGEKPPIDAPTAAVYSKAGLPWFDYYGGDAKVLAGSEIFSSLKSVKEMAEYKNESALPENEPAHVGPVVKIGQAPKGLVRESEF